LVGVMIPVDLDDQSFRSTCEVGEVRSNRMLAAELDPFHSMSAYQLPAQALGAAGVAS
jgi:hypothetical protein